MGTFNTLDNVQMRSFSGDALVTTTYRDDGITRGFGFVFEKNFSIGIGATLYVLFDYTTYTPSASQAGLIYIMPPSFSTTSGLVTVNLYRGTDYAGGTPFIAYNPNTTATKTQSATTLTSGATGVTKGTLALEFIVGGQAQGNQTAAGTSEGASFFIRRNNVKSLVEIVNSSGAAITFHYSQVLYEI